MSNNYERKNATPCMGCMRVLKWIPVLFIASVIVWSYYAYVVELCIFAIDNIFEKIIFIIFYHLIFFLFLWSYWNTIFTPVGTVPQTWRIPDADIERLYRAENQEQQKRILESFAKDYPVCNRTLNGSIRFCDKCRIIKPDRAHHCSVCGICVLKMDHHCPWVNNCVNFNNYKFFVLFLGYALLYCLYVALTSLEYFIRFWRGELNDSMGRFHILFLFFVALMFAISLVSLFGYHIYLVLMNRTTLEAFRAPIFRIGGPDKNGFNLGKFANFQEVFGDNWKLWFLPIYSSKGDGQHYPMSVQRQQQPQPQSQPQPQPQPQPQQKPQSHLQDYYCGQYRPQRNNSIYNSMGMKKNVVGSNVDSCVGASVYSSLEVQPIHQLIETNRILSTPSLPSSQLSLQIPMQCSTGYINSQNMVPQEQHRHQQQQQQQYHQYNTQQSIIEKLNTNEILEGVTVTSTSTTTTAITITPTLPTVASSALSSTSPSNLKKMATIASLLPNGTVFIDMQTNTQKQLKNNLLEQMPQSLTQQTTTPLPLNLNLNLHLPLSNTAAATLSS